MAYSSYTQICLRPFCLIKGQVLKRVHDVPKWKKLDKLFSRQFWYLNRSLSTGNKKSCLLSICLGVACLPNSLHYKVLDKYVWIKTSSTKIIPRIHFEIGTINTKIFLYTEIHSPNHKYGIAEYDFNLLLGKPFFH